MTEKHTSTEIPRSNLSNGLYTQGRIDLSKLNPEEEIRLRQLDFKAWGDGKTMQDPIVMLNQDEHEEFRSLLKKCGHQLIAVNPAKQFFED